MADTRTHVFRASLSPQIHRDFEIPSANNLYDLAGAIVSLFGFDFDHPFGFYSNLGDDYADSPIRYELFFDMGEPLDPPELPPSRSVEKTRIADAFPEVGAKMAFHFDYGDNWHFQLEVIGLGRMEPKVRYPRLVKSVGKAPKQYR
jgi:Plasmid pRiA4b ORF-3-like protein